MEQANLKVQIKGIRWPSSLEFKIDHWSLQCHGTWRDWFTVSKSVTVMQHNLGRHGTVCNVPCHNTIMMWMDIKLPTVSIPVNIGCVHTSIIQNTKQSIQHCAPLHKLLETNMWQIHQINFHVHKMDTPQELTVSEIYTCSLVDSAKFFQ